MTTKNLQKTDRKPYKLGIALSGGGARGFAHLGVLQALNESNLYPDIISGTSAGAFAGALYADGYSPKQAISLFDNRSFKEFAEFTLPSEGLFKSARFLSFLEKHLRSKVFEDLKVKLKVVATDIEHGTSKVFSSGLLIHPIVASCSVPIIFTPVEIEGGHYVDGGLFKNFPVSIIHKECDCIIGVNVSPITSQGYKKSLKYVAERSFHYMSAANILSDRKLCNYLIESKNLSHYSMFDLDHVDEIYHAGYKQTKEYLEENKSKLKEEFPDFII